MAAFMQAHGTAPECKNMLIYVQRVDVHPALGAPAPFRKSIALVFATCAESYPDEVLPSFFASYALA